ALRPPRPRPQEHHQGDLRLPGDPHGRRPRVLRHRRRRLRRPGRRDHRAPGRWRHRREALRVPRARGGGPHSREPAGRARLGRTRPRALLPGGHRRELRPEQEHLHGRRQGQAPGRRAGVGALPRARPAQRAGLPGGEHHGPGLLARRPQRARQGGPRAGDHRRGTPRPEHVRAARGRRLRRRPEAQGRPRQGRGARARRQGRARVAARTARAGGAAGRAGRGRRRRGPHRFGHRRV
ncbi:MAG: hypothetical protein AVDCRST_MAG30-3627, partial [uncultured Solirubrobacteraceae bacterium]